MGIGPVCPCNRGDRHGPLDAVANGDAECQVLRPVLTAPRSICVYRVDVLDAPALGQDGKRYKFDPERLLYALRWKYKALPADVELTLLRERNPPVWFNHVASQRIEPRRSAFVRTAVSGGLVGRPFRLEKPLGQTTLKLPRFEAP